MSLESIISKMSERIATVEKSGGVGGTLAGDVTGTASATVVSKISTFTAAQVASAVTSVNAATSNATASTIMKRDASGNFSANSANLAILTLSDYLNMNNGAINNIGNLSVTGSTRLGDQTSDTIGFFGKTPVVQQWANNATELITALSTMGLIKTVA